MQTNFPLYHIQCVAECGATILTPINSNSLPNVMPPDMPHHISYYLPEALTGIVSAYLLSNDKEIDSCDIVQ